MPLTAALMMIAAPVTNVVAQDRVQCEKLWKAIAADGPPPVSKEAVWALYEWDQAQFSLGYCSAYVAAEDAEKMRHFAGEQAMMKTEVGRSLINQDRELFQAGLDFRKDVKPTLRHCRIEMAGRVETLNAIK